MQTAALMCISTVQLGISKCQRSRDYMIILHNKIINISPDI